MSRPDHVPDHVVIDYDMYGSTKQIDEMHEEMRRWRDEIGPVVWSDYYGGWWIVLGADENRRGLSDVSLFDSSSRGVKLVLVEGREATIPLELDGPEHADYRRLLNPLFAPARVRALDDDVRSVARELIAGFIDRGSCEIVSEYARPLASSMFLSLVNWPLEDRRLLEEWVDRALNGIAGQTEDENVRTQAEAVAAINAYCREQVAERRREPRDDMTMGLMNASVNGAPVPEGRLIGMLILLMNAGLDTTQSVTSRTFAHLAGQPALRDEIHEQRDRIPFVVEEMLRWNAPVGPFRAAARDVEIGGVTIRRGDRVQFMCPVANRDPAEFERPDEVVCDREVNRHLTFGLGPHKCIGAALARTVLVGALDEFHQAIPHYQLADAHSRLGGVWAMDHVRLTW